MAECSAQILKSVFGSPAAKVVEWMCDGLKGMRGKSWETPECRCIGVARKGHSIETNDWPRETDLTAAFKSLAARALKT
jgi:hypothetical protein